MTREQLEAYRSMKEEIKELEFRVKHIWGEGEALIGSSIINDYRSGYPVPQAVVGVDWEKVERTEKHFRNRIALLEQECAAVEDYIESISDSLTRRIFRMYYLDGYSQSEIGKAIHLERSSVSKKINSCFRNT